MVNTREGLRYYTTSVEDHRIVRKFFESQKKEFYTHAIKSELPLKVLLKRLPVDADTEEIKAEFLALGYPVLSVKQFVKTEDGNIIKFPVFPIELDNTEKVERSSSSSSSWSGECHAPPSLASYGVSENPLSANTFVVSKELVITV